MSAIQPLPRSLDPLPYESLAGVLLRLAHRLDLAPSRVAVLTGLGWQLPQRSTIIVPVDRLLYLDTANAATFARATRLHPDEVTGLVLGSLGGRYPPLDINHQTSDGVPRQATGIPGLSRWVFTRSTRYCPQCLAGDGSPIQQAHGGAWQKWWHLPVVFACMVHRRLLLHQCPGCSRPVHSHHGGGLLPRLTDATLHPVQCRIPIGAGGHWRRQTACGTWLNRPASPPSIIAERPQLPLPPLDRLLAVQEKLLGLLGIGSNDPTNAELISVGRPATAAQYFLDLRLVVGLLQASWPQARALAEPWMPTDTVDYHLEQQRQQATTVHQAQSRTLDVAIYDRPPLEAAACGSLLALADRILTLDDLPAARSHLGPLIAHVVARRNSWGELLRGAAPHCSVGLRAAITPQIQTRRGQDSYVVPMRDYRFGPQHIPQFLPAEWYDPHFQDLTGLQLPVLRRLAAIKLVQLTQGGLHETASQQLGLPARREFAATGYVVQRWARDQQNAARLRAALEALAAELDAIPAGGLIDYRRRRDALRAWSIPRDDWRELATELRRRQKTTAQLLTDWGESKRLAASVLVWTRVTHGEHFFAPLVLEEQRRSGRRQLASLASRVAHGSRVGRPQHHHARLMTALDAYADQLAARIDAGESAELQLASVFLAS
jgi:TniQ